MPSPEPSEPGIQAKSVAESRDSEVNTLGSLRTASLMIRPVAELTVSDFSKFVAGQFVQVISFENHTHRHPKKPTGPVASGICTRASATAVSADPGGAGQNDHSGRHYPRYPPG